MTASPKIWITGARPRTLPAAVVPVLVGTAVGWWWNSDGHGRFDIHPVGSPDRVFWYRALGALVLALAIQIGTNYANDHADGVRGTDDDRVGPVRLVASGLASPTAVKCAALIAYAVAAAVGIALAAVTTWWLIPVGALCFAAGWLYTGGPKPYGYMGFGELSVFIFFGVVATAGSAFLEHPHLHSFPPLVLLAAIPPGLLAVALLQANNLRDIQGDTAADKRTLAVRLGRRRAGHCYMGIIAAAYLGVLLIALVRPLALLALITVPLAITPLRIVRGGAEGAALLGATGRVQTAVGILLTVGILL